MLNPGFWCTARQIPVCSGKNSIVDSTQKVTVKKIIYHLLSDESNGIIYVVIFFSYFKNTEE